jgi:electron transport complex protein RnfB
MTPPATAVPVPLPIPVPIRIIGCRGCGACLLTCPQHALRPVPGGLRVRADRCTGCLECLEICPVDAISATLLEPSGARFRHPIGPEENPNVAVGTDEGDSL